MNDYACTLETNIVNQVHLSKTKRTCPTYKKESKSSEILKRAFNTSSSYRLKMKFLVEQFGILKTTGSEFIFLICHHWLSKQGQDL